jgi:hypothetical protein
LPLNSGFCNRQIARSNSNEQAEDFVPFVLSFGITTCETVLLPVPQLPPRLRPTVRLPSFLTRGN